VLSHGLNTKVTGRSDGQPLPRLALIGQGAVGCPRRGRRISHGAVRWL